MEYLFLREDLEALERHITELKNAVREAGAEAGEFTHQSSETWHDNYGFEDAKRTVLRLTKDIEALLDIRARAHVVGPGKRKGTAGIGSTITVRELPSRKKRVVRIGSYYVPEESGAISYASALGSILYGARTGKTKTGCIAGKEKRFFVEKVE